MKVSMNAYRPKSVRAEAVKHESGPVWLEVFIGDQESELEITVFAGADMLREIADEINAAVAKLEETI